MAGKEEHSDERYATWKRSTADFHGEGKSGLLEEYLLKGFVMDDERLKIQMTTPQEPHQTTSAPLPSIILMLQEVEDPRVKRAGWDNKDLEKILTK